MDFQSELRRLVEKETIPIGSKLMEVIRAERNILFSIDEQAKGLSSRMEDIYEIIKDGDDSINAAKTSLQHEQALISTAIALSDLIDTFINFAGDKPELSDQARMMQQQTEKILSRAKMESFGKLDDPINPKLYNVSGAIYSEKPFEHVATVLEKGYMFENKLIRKASVIVSKGANTEIGED
jgi:molecular chaperone GrpE (heat shock protein)